MKTKTSSLTILLVEDDELFCESISDYLSRHYNIQKAGTAEEGLEIIKEELPDLVLLDIFLPGMSGIELLEKIKASWVDLPVIMLTAMSQISKVVQTIKMGAFDYLTKNTTEIAEKLLLCIENALESSTLKRQLEQRKKLQLATNKEYQLLGTSPALEKIRRQIHLLAGADTTVLVQGETGTGKELIAREIHAGSLRATESFVAINCGAIPKDLIEAELFGHSKGAFTGAASKEVGKFLLANHGTLLLDEIGELSMEAQTKLLRVLEEQEFYPVGSSKLTRVDVRVVASTNRNLEKMGDQGLFRQDLFFRLNVCSISVPPLKERPEDILFLANHFMGLYNIKFGKSFESISPGAREILLNHSWKGNVRELRNVIERIVLFEEARTLEESHLVFLNPSTNPAPSKTTTLSPSSSFKPGNLDDMLKETEKDFLLKALEMAKGNKTRAAEYLSLSRAAYCYRLGKYDMDD